VSYAGDLTLLEALMKSGGRLPEAADDVLIVRAVPPNSQEEPTTVTVNARELENGVGLSRNPVLQDGDAIFVRKAQAVTVTGYVRSVGAYNIESGMNVEQVLALAGGVDPLRGSDRRIEIVRMGKTIKNVKKSDVVQPGDIIKVGRRVM
jgi:polysaccharide export outer membrane protein